MGVLRYLLAISVLVFHFDPTLKFGLGGQLAVRAFFIISGFYISMILAEKYKDKKFTLFFSNRLLRILPLYFVVILITYLVNWSFKIPNFHDHQDWMSFSLTTKGYIIFTNVAVVGQALNFFLSVDHSGSLFFTKDLLSNAILLPKFMILGQGWTVDLELIFYVISPFLVFKSTKKIALLIFASVLLRVVLLKFLHMPAEPWGMRFIGTELTFFLLGMLTYRFKDSFSLSRKLMFLIYGTVILFTIFYLYVFYVPGINVSILHFSYIILVTFSIPYIFSLSKKNKLDRYIGELSYPIYLCQGISISILHYYGLNQIIVAVMVTTLLSIILNETISKPIEKYRQKRVA